MSARPLVLIGGGGHASDVLQVVEAVNAVSATYDVIGILDDATIDGRRFVGRGVQQIGVIADLEGLDAAYLLCIGWPWTRRAVAERVRSLGEAAPPLVHPRAGIGAGVRLGRGSVVLGNAHVSPMVRLGDHSIVSYQSSVGHDAVFGDFASIMPNAAVSGDVVAGAGVLVGSGAVVREGVRLGDDVRVGAGAVVVGDVAPNLTVVGVPARPLN